MADVEKIAIIKLELDVDKYTADAVDLNKKIKALNDAQKELKKNGQETSLEYQRNKETLKGLSTQLAQTNKTIQDLNRANSAQEGSNEQLRASLSVLTAEYNKLSQTQREETTQGREMGQQIATITSTLKENESAVGDNRRNVGNYVGAMKELKAELKATKDQMLILAGTVGTNSKEFEEAKKKAGQLQDRLDDVNEAAKATATGSGFQSFKNQIALVGKDLGELDFAGAGEKSKALASSLKGITFKDMIAGAKGFAVSLYEMGTAMFALPITWIVAGLAAIALGWQYISKSTQESAQKQVDALDKVQERYVAVYDTQVKLYKAAGVENEKAEMKKLQVVKATTQRQIQILEMLQDSIIGLNDDQKKQLEDLRKKKLENQADILAAELAHNKKLSDERQKERDKEAKEALDVIKKRQEANLKALEEQRAANEARLADNKRFIEEMQNQRIALIKDDEIRELAKITLDNSRRIEEIARSKADNKVKLDAMLLQQEQYERDINDTKAKFAKEREEQEKKEAQARIDRVKTDAEKMAKDAADPVFKWNGKTLEDKVATDKAIVESAKKREAAIRQIEQEGFEFTKNMIDSLVAIENNRTQTEIENLNAETKIKLDNLQREADTGVITADELSIAKQRIEMDAAKETSKLKKRQFELEKKASLIQVGINTAQGVANALTVQPAYLAAAQVAFALATGALQAQVINSKPTPEFAGGGRAVISGQRVSSSHGDSKFFKNGDTMLAAIKQGEVVLNDRQQALLGGPKTFQRIGVPGFADGGLAARVVSSGVESEVRAEQQMEFLLSNLPPQVVTVQDINEAQNTLVRVEDRANI